MAEETIDLSFLATLPGHTDGMSESELAEIGLKDVDVVANPDTGNVYEKGRQPATTDPAKAAPEGKAAKAAETTPDKPAGATDTSAIDENDLPEIFRKGAAAPVVKDAETGISLVKEKLEVDLSNPEGYGKLIENFTGLRDEVQVLKESDKELKAIKASIANLPPAVKSSIQAFEKGANWEEAFMQTTGKAIDFSKPVASQPADLLIKNFATDLMTAEEFADDPDSRESKYALSIAKEKFQLAKQNYDSTVLAKSREAEDLGRRYGESIDASLEAAKRAFPNGSGKELKSVYETLKSGEFDNLFFTEDGVFKPDAMQKLVYAEHGPKMIESYQKTINKLMESNTRLSNQLADIAGKGSERAPEGTKPAYEAATPGTGNPEVPEHLSYLGSFDEYLSNTKSKY